MKMERLYRGDYIHGQFHVVKESNGEVFSQDPGDLSQESLAFPFQFERVNEAVLSAKRSFLSWKRMPSSDRCAALKKYRDLLEKRTEDLAHCITYEIGKPLWESRKEVSTTLELIDFYLDKGAHVKQDVEVEHPTHGLIGTYRHHARGILALVSASNMPSFIPHSQFIPSLIEGNTLVFRTTKNAPLTGQVIAEIFHDSGIPGGVFNLIHGDSELARRLITHEDVNGVFYTGAYERAVQIRKQVLADYGKTLVLNVAGKNSMILWNDCDYEKALRECLYASYVTAGQRRASAHQILVHKDLVDRFLTEFHQQSKKITIDHGLSESNPFMGPLANERTVESYLRHQGIAIREGCEEVMRGKPLERKTRGHYVSPSIHFVPKVDSKSVYQKDEFFGPNVAIYAVDDLDEVSEIINQTQYGLVASLYTKEKKHHARLVEEVEVGTLNWNVPTTAASYFLPTGGVRRSGNGRPMGSMAYLQCTFPLSSIESKEVSFPLPEALPKLEGQS